MPHESDVRSTSHDRHDPILVAALAAGDLSGADRDLALDRTRFCTDCRALHDDLVALARATADAPPPIATRPRDFRLTPADAARLRPMGWRRLVAAFTAPRLTVARPLGVGLTTLGLVGLLVGNVQLGLGSSAALPTSSGSEGVQSDLRSAASAPAASGLPGSVDIMGPGAAASGPPAASGPLAASGAAGMAPGPTDVVTYTDGSHDPVTAGGPEIGGPSADTKTTLEDGAQRPATAVDPVRPINLLFATAILVGLTLLVASRLARRPSA